MIQTYILLGILVIVGITLLSGIRIVRPTHILIIETFGKYTKICEAGFVWIIPLIQRGIFVNITEKMVDAEPQEIITKDKLNASVDAQVYFKIRSDEQSIKNSQYNVFNCEEQIVSLARTTLRNIIGTMPLNDANSKRDNINTELMTVLSKETKNWGIEIVRTELKEINPPKDVQDTMNKVVIAENEKQAAVDFATATETKADGERRALVKIADGNRESSILVAEGNKQSAILEAEGQAKAFDLINKSFTGNAQILKKLDVAENSLKGNAKIIIGTDTELVNVVSDLAGTPLPIKSKKV